MNDDNSNNSDFQLPPPSPSHRQIFPNFASSSSATDFRHQNPRKKRSKMIKITASSSSGSGGMLKPTGGGIMKPKYGKKPDPGAPKITRPCSECGKKFWSWKALFGHMRCHPERTWRGINPPPNHWRPTSPANRMSHLEAAMTEEDHDVAECLLMLSIGSSSLDTLCGSVSEQGLLPSENDTFVRDAATGGGETEDAGTSSGNCRFECSSCKKVFGSHQALGGHRASHKNVKGCFAITRNDGEDDQLHHGEDRDGQGEAHANVDEKMAMVLGHRCSICLRVFPSGQALGGHKRCHFEKWEEPPSLPQGVNPFGAREGCEFDLNLPPPLEDDSSTSYSSGLSLDLRLGI